MRDILSDEGCDRKRLPSRSVLLSNRLPSLFLAGGSLGENACNQTLKPEPPLSAVVDRIDPIDAGIRVSLKLPTLHHAKNSKVRTPLS